jgi:hypothetical protein
MNKTDLWTDSTSLRAASLARERPESSGVKRDVVEASRTLTGSAATFVADDR